MPSAFRRDLILEGFEVFLMETSLMIDNRRAVKNLPATAPSIIETSLLAFWWHIKYQSPS